MPADRKRAADLPFDSRPVDGATLTDLDLVLFEREYLPSVLTNEVLEALRDECRNRMEARPRVGVSTVDRGAGGRTAARGGARSSR